MIEFGSDFHYIDPGIHSENTLYDFYPSANLYADGRQALIHLYQTQGWQRLWVPEYFCYDVVESLENAGLNLRFYADCPDYHRDDETLETIQRKGLLRPTDAVLRVNYYGIRSYRTPVKLPVAAIVEDHTHDLIGDWATNSHADWCISSLRKTLPIPEGGILWSPVGLRLPPSPQPLEENEQVATTRWVAMRLKTRYLAGDAVEKPAFRSGYVDTEEFFDRAPVCSIDVESREYLKRFDIRAWYNQKRENWEVLRGLERDNVRIIVPDNMGCYPFSLILLFDSQSERDRVRKELIDCQVYPAILWNVPSATDGDVFMFSRRMLSVHCDGRYDAEDIKQLKSIIETIL